MQLVRLLGIANPSTPLYIGFSATASVPIKVQNSAPSSLPGRTVLSDSGTTRSSTPSCGMGRPGVVCDTGGCSSVPNRVGCTECRHSQD